MGVQLTEVADLNITLSTTLKAKGVKPFAYEYRAAYLTPAVIDVADQARKDGKTTQNLLDQVVGLVASWDVFEGDTRLPVTVENAKKLPTHVLSGFIIGAYRDLNDLGEDTAARTSTT